MIFTSIDKYFEEKKGSKDMSLDEDVPSYGFYENILALVNYIALHFPNAVQGDTEIDIIRNAQKKLKKDYAISDYYTPTISTLSGSELMNFRQQTINYMIKHEEVQMQDKQINTGDIVVVNSTARGRYSQTIPGSKGSVKGRISDNSYDIMFIRLGTINLDRPRKFENIEGKYLDKIAILPRDTNQAQSFVSSIVDNVILSGISKVIDNYISSEMITIKTKL